MGNIMIIRGKRTDGTEFEKNTSIKEKILDLSGLKLASLDLSPLAECTILNRLFLDNNQLASLDLSPLAGCKKLIALGLQNNNLKSLDLSPLAGCKKLVDLNLKNNQLEALDLSPLAECKALTHLSIDPGIQLFIDIELLNEIFPQPIEGLKPHLQRSIVQQTRDDFIEFDNIEHLSLKYTARQLLKLLLSDNITSSNPENIDENARDAISGNLGKFARLIELEGKRPPSDGWLIDYCFEKSASLRQGIKNSKRIKDLLKKRLRQQLLGEIPAGETEEISVSMQEEIDKLLISTKSSK